MLNILLYIIPPQSEGNFLPTQTSKKGALKIPACYYLLQYYFYIFIALLSMIMTRSINQFKFRNGIPWIFSVTVSEITFNNSSSKFLVSFLMRGNDNHIVRDLEWKWIDWNFFAAFIQRSKCTPTIPINNILTKVTTKIIFKKYLK